MEKITGTDRRAERNEKLDDLPHPCNNARGSRPKKKKRNHVRTKHVRICVNTSRVLSITLTSPTFLLFSKFSLVSFYFDFFFFFIFFFLSRFANTMENRNVCRCKNAALYTILLVELLAFVTRNKCYYCLPNTIPANISFVRSHSYSNTHTMARSFACSLVCSLTCARSIISHSCFASYFQSTHTHTHNEH